MINFGIVQFRSDSAINSHSTVRKGQESQLLKDVDGENKFSHIKAERIARKSKLFCGLTAQAINFTAECRENFEQAFAFNVQALEHRIPANVAVYVHVFLRNRRDIEIGGHIQEYDIPKSR